jgi:hypothetical protein
MASGRAEADAVFGAFNAVIDDLSVHESLRGLLIAPTIGRNGRK